MKINNLEHFLSVTDSGKTATGIVITSHDASISELAADCGCDFVWIDLEHSPLTIVDAMHHVMALRGTNCAPFVRVAWNLPYLLKPVLDLAPAAVIVPMVNNARMRRRPSAPAGIRSTAASAALRRGAPPVMTAIRSPDIWNFPGKNRGSSCRSSTVKPFAISTTS